MTWTNDILNSNHALIAGCSGSGKSVALNNIMYEALNDVSNLYVLIDLKRVELAAYRTLPQTLAYVDHPDDVKPALNAIMRVIDKTYDKMQANGQRKTDGAHIYVVIDEFADLAVTCDKATMDLIQRISQIGRAAGVHLIICTQRPTKEVIKGAISVNLETRLALRCTCAQDSRNIIGVAGAETLPKYGHGILQYEGYNTMIDIPLVSDEDINARVADRAKLMTELLRQHAA